MAYYSHPLLNKISPFEQKEKPPAAVQLHETGLSEPPSVKIFILYESELWNSETFNPEEALAFFQFGLMVVNGDRLFTAEDYDTVLDAVGCHGDVECSPGPNKPVSFFFFFFLTSTRPDS